MTNNASSATRREISRCIPHHRNTNPTTGISNVKRPCNAGMRPVNKPSPTTCIVDRFLATVITREMNTKNASREAVSGHANIAVTIVPGNTKTRLETMRPISFDAPKPRTERRPANQPVRMASTTFARRANRYAPGKEPVTSAPSPVTNP